MTRSALTLLLLAVCVGGAGCAPERPVTDTARPAVDDSTPRDGGTLIRRLDADIVTLNPIAAQSRYDRWVTQYLFTPLIEFDQSLQPIPALAESWKISGDGRVYRFELQKKATFSDGRPVRASDVLFTLRKIVDPASEAVQVIGAFELLDLANTKVIDDHTIEVAFREALANQLSRFNDVLVMPEHVYAKGSFRNDYNATAVGSGPYKLVRRVPGKEVVMERRADYWGERPHIQTVVFRVINDHATALNALKRGELHETLVTSDVWMREHNNPELAKTIDFRRFYSLNYTVIVWNNRHPFLNHRDVRRALAMCIPIETVISELYRGTARPLSGPFTPDQWAFNPRVPVMRHDPEEAKLLLAKHGWKDTNADGLLDRGGKPFRVQFLYMSGNATTQQFAQMLQAELKKVGVDLELVLLDGATAIQRILAGNYEAAYMGWDLDPDPDPYNLFHSSQVPPRGQNIVFYANPEVDRLLESGRRELDRSKRQETYQKLHELLAADQPYTWTMQTSAKWALHKSVRNAETSRGRGLFLWYPGELGWWLAPQPR